MAKARKTVRPSRAASVYDRCAAEWDRRKAERRAQFAKAQRAGIPEDSIEDLRPGARFVAPDPIRSAESGGDWLVDKPELPLNAVPFLATLRSLGYQLQDQRYLDLHRELIESVLIDRATGKWSRWGTVLANPETRFVCEMINQSIAAGLSEREALAEAVLELGIDAASFDAAYRRLKELRTAFLMGEKPV
jgi:hypothetical protein